MRLELSERIRIRESFMSWVKKKGVFLDIPKQLLNKISLHCEDVVNENTTGFYCSKIDLYEGNNVSIYNSIRNAKQLGYGLLRSGQALVSIINNMNECVDTEEISLPLMFPLVDKSKKFSLFGYFDGKNFHISTLKNSTFINPGRVYFIAINKNKKPIR